MTHVDMNNAAHRVDFYYILEKRIGFGKYQFLNSLCPLVASQLEGIELLLISVIMPHLFKEWGMSKMDKIMMT